MELMEIEDLKSPPRPPLERLLREVAIFLRTMKIHETIQIDRDFNVSLKDSEKYHALKIIGVSKVPVTVDGNEKIDLTLDELGFRDNFPRNIFRVCRDHSELITSCWPTPLFFLRSFSGELNEVWAKLEYLNPFSNSIKDRIGWYMLIDILKNDPRGKDTKYVYEASSTNTGIALTCIAKNFGLRTKIYFPSSVQKSSDLYMKILGSEVVRVPEFLTTETIDRVKRDSEKDQALHINQFENDANFITHLKFTAKEIDLQLEKIGKIPSRIICALGTSGHASAIAFYFKNRYPGRVEVVGVQPAKDEVIPGMRRVETGMKWIHMVEIDRIVDVTRVEAFKGLVKVARNEGLPVGFSSGAVVAALEKLPKIEGVTVLVMPDHVYKYYEQLEKLLSTNSN
ncbi:MAG: pyridoxal-phosphate dependent enzyme [Nitrososphaerota archaeon]